ncbi:retrotransposon protein, putative, ty1-copia subclass [Tanacetum coccineum]
MHDMGKTVTELHAMLKIHEQTLPKKDGTHALHAIRVGKVQKKKHKNKKPQLAARGNNQGKRKSKLAYAPKPKIPPPLKKNNLAKDAICHQCGDVGYWKRKFPQYLAELLKNKKLSQGASTLGIFTIELYTFPNNTWVYDTGCGEYMGQEFLDHLKEHRIIAHRTPPYTPQHNGMFERRNRTLLDMVRSMMSQTTLLKSFWDYALESVARIPNMVPTKKGYEALVKRDTLTKPDKLEPRSLKCIFLGYAKETMGYSFYYPSENKIFVARNAEFLENSLIIQEASRSLEDLEIIQEEDTYPSGDHNEPANYKAALLDPESDKWLDAMNVEMQSMKDNEVWDLVDLPPNGKIVGRKWLFKKKTDVDGAIHTYKARLVVKGFTQTYRVDYEETFSPVAYIKAIMILIAITAFYDYEICQNCLPQWTSF